MRELLDLFVHNAWANRQVFDAAQTADAELLDTQAPGTRDTVGGTLRHLARVEYSYLAMIEQRPLEGLEPREAYEAHDLAWFGKHIDELGSAYVRLVETLADDDLERPLKVPWFDFPLTVRDGLLQVLSHSAQHRSQVLSWLSAQGIATPDLDYVTMLAKRHTTVG